MLVVLTFGTEYLKKANQDQATQFNAQKNMIMFIPFIFGPANPEQHPDPEQPLATEC
jgi:hypothetical protein